ncbi:hypothetical protein HBB16_02760 [Pseudonocardia sp. MCCB 268]|nr:hypothetical protein [Pseudonocardia cytotoxica]
MVREQAATPCSSFDRPAASRQLALTKTVVVHPLRPLHRLTPTSWSSSAARRSRSSSTSSSPATPPRACWSPGPEHGRGQADALNIPDQVEVSLEAPEIGTHYYARDLDSAARRRAAHRP